MTITTSTPAALARTRATHGATSPQQSSNLAQDQFVSASQRLTGAAVGFAKGAQVGLALDALTLGIPILLGYSNGGAVGALVGASVLPVSFGLFQALGGFASPQQVLNQK